jgi:hypothetical protein
MAIQRSKRLVEPLRSTLAVPFLGLLFLSRALDPIKGILLTRIPERFYRELPEIPLALLILATIASVIIGRWD